MSLQDDEKLKTEEERKEVELKMGGHETEIGTLTDNLSDLRSQLAKATEIIETLKQEKSDVLKEKSGN